MGEKVRVFELHRDTDATGVSGEGVVAVGVVWPDGMVSLRWRPGPDGGTGSCAFWPGGLDEMYEVHGHDGLTRVVFAP